MDSLLDALFKALYAKEDLTPITTHKMRPGFTRAIQESTDPFPFPIRTSIGLFVTGIFGKILNCNFPIRFNFLVTTLRRASISLDEILPISRAFKTYPPKTGRTTFCSFPLILPLNTFLYFVCDGLASIMIFFKEIREMPPTKCKKIKLFLFDLHFIFLFILT